jgi:hypothetical protein
MQQEGEGSREEDKQRKLKRERPPHVPLAEPGKAGRRTYAIGNNPTGAWYSGINVKRHNLALFALVGLMAGCCRNRQEY